MADLVSYEQLRHYLHYDPITGLFTWLQKTGKKVVIGTTAGNPNTAGYIVIGLLGEQYYAHRLAWFYMTETWPRQVDHEDNDRSNNRWINLRLATHQQNVFNAKLAKNSTSGFKGVSWHKAARKWGASITINGASRHLGLFPTPDEAHAAYLAAVKDVQPNFARSK